MPILGMVLPILGMFNTARWGGVIVVAKLSVPQSAALGSSPNEKLQAIESHS
jgi:hypothetical protein